MDEIAYRKQYKKKLFTAVTVRSPVARGRLRSIDSGSLPTGYRLITAADIPGKNRLTVFQSHMPVLAKDILSYRGMPLGLLVGNDEEELSTAAERIHIDAVPAEPRFLAATPGPATKESDYRISYGDMDFQKQQAVQVLEERISTPPQEHYYPEPHSAFALRKGREIEVHTYSRWPYHVKTTVAEVLGINPEQVSIQIKDEQTVLDGKVWSSSLVAAHAALAAWLTGKPVLLRYNRQEDFLYTSKRAPVSAQLRTHLSAEGYITAREIDISCDAGAFPLFEEEMLERICLGAVGQHYCPAMNLTGRIVTTNKPPMNAFEGLGTSQGLFISEVHGGRAAYMSEQDPYEWKKRHIKPDIEEEVPRFYREAEAVLPALESVVDRSDYRRKHAAYEMRRKRRSSLSKTIDMSRGIGLSTGYQGNGFIGRKEVKLSKTVRVSMDTAGNLSISTSSISEALQSYWKEMAARTLDISPEQVHFTSPATSTVPDTGPSILARNLTVTSRLLKQCFDAIKKRRFREALPIEIQRSYRLPPKHAWNHESFEGYPFPQSAWGASVVEVEVDSISFELTIRGIWLMISGGVVINRRRLVSSLEEGIRSALGWSYHEILSRGKAPDEGDWHRYHLLPPAATPPVYIDFLEDGNRSTIKGISQLPYSTIPPAFAVAVSQATGLDFDSLPITSERLKELEESS
ncbi:MAG: molybdopterin-dependent oxidoreductase [Spirochaetales bacterium]|nr:molybdopterin-dependent oxidoreductase [Spirochaetales bacterium]MCF7937080.1 molybdopterin-dependent oxidoreductase [Spirochaetales bacterium]